MAAGLIVLAGWQFHSSILKGEILGTLVAPSSAVCFILCSASNALQIAKRRWLRRLGWLAGLTVIISAAVATAEYIFQFSLGTNRWLSPAWLVKWRIPPDLGMGEGAALAFLLAGLSLVTFRKQRGRPYTEIFALLMLLIAYQSVLTYLYSSPSAYGRLIPVPDLLLFCCTSVALLCGASRHMILESMLSPFAGAVASRRMIAAIALLLPAIGLVALWTERAGWLSPGLRMVLTTVAAVTVFTILALRTAVVLNETDRKRVETEAALLKSEKLAAAGRMAASVAHEINNPLEAIGNILFLLRSTNLPDDVRLRYLHVAEAELVRVSAIARRTLGFYKDEVKPTEVNLRAAIESVIDIYRPKLQGQLKVRTAYCPDPTIVAKEGEIRQVLTNLVSNAIDALSASGGLLDVSVRRSGRHLFVEVKDDGPGIPPPSLEHVFEPFYTTKKEIGTGLGLWVSKELVTKNGGSISVITSTNPKDHGTIFRLSFPVLHKRTAAASEASPAISA